MLSTIAFGTMFCTSRALRSEQYKSLGQARLHLKDISMGKSYCVFIILVRHASDPRKYLGSLPVLTILSPQQAADEGLLGLAYGGSFLSGSLAHFADSP